jgi:hypothetical protein
MAISTPIAQQVTSGDDVTVAIGCATAVRTGDGCGWWCPGAIGRTCVLWLGAVVVLELPVAAGLAALRTLREQDFGIPALIPTDPGRDALRMLVLNESTRCDLSVYRHLGIRVRRGRWLILPQAGMDWGAWRRVRCEEVPEGRAIGPCRLEAALTVAIATLLADTPTLTAVTR